MTFGFAAETLLGPRRVETVGDDAKTSRPGCLSCVERDAAVLEHSGHLDLPAELGDDLAQHVEGEPDLTALDLGDRRLGLADQLGQLDRITALTPAPTPASAQAVGGARPAAAATVPPSRDNTRRPPRRPRPPLR